ncbi:hypothetical protein DFH07DRAFT_783321 [Mycena maculata]|uniref:Uncharacterized protein n=1 Tax=Mycena maculata TaxID=230809 RepID=A0AAD7HMT0_9AGAR|nr:hypothetical protein DFH07DRAFT_783321 [Mycena maculata]
MRAIQYFRYWSGRVDRLMRQRPIKGISNLSECAISSIAESKTCTRNTNSPTNHHQLMTSLPPELVETVIRLVYDSETLKACSLLDNIEHLDIRGIAIPESMYTAIDLILDSKAAYLERVHTLELPMRPDEPAPADRIIAAVATTVQHLAIDYGDCHRPRPNDGLHFPPLPALRSIVLTLHLGQVPQLPVDLYSTITSFPHVMPNIEHITLVFVMYMWEQQIPWRDGGVFALFARGQCDWHTQLPRLHRLDCSLDLDYPDSPATDVLFDAFAVHMEERFPALQSTGILTISRRVRRRLEPGELV